MNLLFYDEVLRGVEARIRDQEWSLLITFVHGSSEAGFPRLQAFSGMVDGMLIGEGIVPSPYIERLAARVPVVIIAGALDERAADVVTADNRSGSFALVTHLIRDHGRRRLFFVGGPPDAPDANERRYGLEHALRAYPECRVTGWFQGQFNAYSGDQAGQRLAAMPRGELPDAVVCGNDQTAIGVIRALSRAGIRVPEEMAVVGFDDIFPGSLCDPPLTTVHQPMRMLGERACDRLLGRIADPALRPRVDVLPTELVLRSSCGCPPGTAHRQPIQSLAPALPVPVTTPPRSPRAGRMARRAADA
jgi:LacI family transcriptional regulator